MTKRSEKRLPRPLYEALPWLYVLLGLIALVASYLVQSLAVLSALLGLAGFAVLLGGVVVVRDLETAQRVVAEHPELRAVTWAGDLLGARFARGGAGGAWSR